MSPLEARCAEIRAMRRQPAEPVEVIARVSDMTGIPAADILHTTKHSPAATEARHLAMFECRRSGLTLDAIARAFGRDRSTVIHAVRKETARREGRP